METFTDTESDQTYSNGNRPGILPNPLPSTSDRDATGILKQDVIQKIVISLKNSRFIPSLEKKGSYEEFVLKQEALITNIKTEYDFYESRYEAAITKLFESIRAGYTNNTTENRTIINTNLAASQLLNRKLNDLTQIINGITDNMLSTTSLSEVEIKAFDKKIRDKQEKLQKQNSIITSSQATAELNKQMVKFTEQKAKYSNNLLGLYSFLNVVALGLLVYVYKSSSE